MGAGLGGSVLASLVLCTTERRVSLGSRCTVDDVCDDVSASCVDGVCVCRLTHYVSSGRCGNYDVIIVIIIITIIVIIVFFFLFFLFGVTHAFFACQR